MVKKNTISLNISHPDIAAKWHPDKNDGLEPEMVVAGSWKKVWWRCTEGPDHEWQAPVMRLAPRGHGCPYCAGKKPSVTNSLSEKFSNVAIEWHPTKNGTLTPDLVVAGSNKKGWWKCPKGEDHEWAATIASRTGGGRGCPFCRGFSVSVTNSLKTFSDVLSEQWHPYKNGNLTPDMVVAGSNKKAWWKCPGGPDHEWDAVIDSRTRAGRGCPFCSHFYVSVTNSLKTLFNELSEEWHPTKNGKLTPELVVAGSPKKAWWKCREGSDHEWDATIASRAGGERGCPFCAGQKPSLTNSLAAIYPDLIPECHPYKNGNLTPDMVVAASNKKVWWKCPKGEDHEWQAIPDKRGKYERGCRFCAGKSPSVTNSLAAICPDLIPEWHPTKNGTLTPDKVVSQSHKKVWWQCPTDPGHEWDAVIQSRSSARNGCPYCTLYPSSKQEIGLAFELRIFFDFDVDDHNELVGRRVWHPDIIIRKHRLIVEFDGSWYHRGRDRFDVKKTDALRDAGWNVIRVREQPLPIISSMDVSVPININMKPAADAVLLKIQESLNIQIDGLDDYIKQTEPQTRKASERYIRRLLESKPST